MQYGLVQDQHPSGGKKMTIRHVGRAILLPQFAAFLLLGCSAVPPAKVNFDSEQDFSTYQSFAWLSENPMKVAKTVVEPRESLEASIMAAIRVRLESLGFDYASNAAAANFLVSFTVGSREKIDREAYPSTSSGSVGRGGWATAFYGGGSAAAYTQGILAVDIFDAEEQRPVWHGVHGKKITEEERADMDATIAEVVALILAAFPPV
jgi:hypothetical protein